MIPAPAQGAMMVVTRQDNSHCLEALALLNDKETELCTGIERQFLKVLEGGCTAPIGALAEVIDHRIVFQGILLSLDGQEVYRVFKEAGVEQHEQLGRAWAEEILEQGGQQLMKELKVQLKK